LKVQILFYLLNRYFFLKKENDGNPFTSPVQLHTNVEGGQGLFAIENITSFDVEL